MNEHLSPALHTMMVYYKYQMEHNTGFKKEYYRGKFEATELLSRHVIVRGDFQIDYYVDFLKKKGLIRGCDNCAKNPRINPKVKDLPGCGENECYQPEYGKWEMKK